MKVYQVVMSYFDGDHDHGRYQSPLFARKADAERFLRAVCEAYENDQEGGWWTDRGYSAAEDGPAANACINEIEVLDEWDGELKGADHYLSITYT